ncbi:Spy/CpxP family protein refolding chaperone [Hydrogenimonas sp.]
MKWVLTLLLVFGIALADEDRYEDHEREEYELHLPRDLSRLELTPAQERAIGDLLVQNMHHLHRLHEQEERLRERLRALFVQERFDKKRFEEALDSLHRERVKIEAELFARIHALLTPRQRRLFVRHMKEWEIE